ncbi:MAG: aldose 1-epimerase family protein [Pirellulales bacterium]|nr:aldose 1-epimerase family protein [Pirellulales bacterium]
MAEKTWILTDVENDVYVDQLTVGPKEAGGTAQGYSVGKRTLRGGLQEGVDVVEIDNGRLRIVVLPTRGMNLWRVSLGDLQLGWNSPVKGPVHPKFVRLDAPDGAGWLDGFDEFFCHCGLHYNGGPEFHPNGTLRFGLHGKVSNIPAHKVEVAVDGESGTISVRGEVDEARAFGNKLRLTTTVTTRVGSPELTVTDVVSNAWGLPSEMELLYHINVGVPLLGDGARLFVPVKKVAPRYPGEEGDIAGWDRYGPETPGFKNVVLLTESLADAAGRTLAVLQNAAADRGMAVKYNKNQLPYFTLWKNLQPAADGYVTGLEPATNYPHTPSIENRQGRVIVLQPGESHTSEITIEALPDAEAVSRAVRAVAEIQGQVVPEVSSQPNPQWSG